MADLSTPNLQPFSGKLDGEVEPFDGLLDSEKSSVARRVVGDTGLSLLKGAIAVPEAAVGIADIPTGGAAGKAAEAVGFRPKDAKAVLDEYLSPEQKAANKKLADTKGFFPTVATAVENPSTIYHSVVESLPQMGAGGVVARGILPTVGKVVGPASAPYVAGAVGEGAVGLGSAAEQIRQASPTGTLDPRGTAAAVGSGVGTAFFGAAGGKLAQKLKIADIDTMIAGGTLAGPAGASKKGFVRKLAEGAISEGVFEELPQSAQEQMWQNYALNKPIMEGVAEAGAMGMLAGAAMGGPVAALASPQEAPAPAPPPPGPMTSAAIVARATGAAPGPEAPTGGAPSAPAPATGAIEGALKPLFGFTEEGAGMRARILEREGKPHRIVPHPEREDRFSVLPDSVSTAVDEESRIRGLEAEGNALIEQLKGKAPRPAVAEHLAALDKEIAQLRKSQEDAKTKKAEGEKATLLKRAYELLQKQADEEGGFAEQERAPLVETVKASEGTGPIADKLREKLGVRPGEKPAPAAPAEPVPDAPWADPERKTVGNGTRKAPVQVSTSADLEAAAAKASTDHTPPQGEANNVQRGHVQWQGLDGTIEVAAGGTRRGMNPDTGASWETTHSAPYGYWKGTKGADGMHVDAIWGPELEAGHPVYVLDEYDEKGKFRQHKTLPGFASEQAAREAYLGISSKKADHIGAVTAMPVEAFKTWLKESDLTKPVAAKQDATPLATPMTVPSQEDAGPAEAAPAARDGEVIPANAEFDPSLPFNPNDPRTYVIPPRDEEEQANDRQLAELLRQHPPGGATIEQPAPPAQEAAPATAAPAEEPSAAAPPATTKPTQEEPAKPEALPAMTLHANRKHGKTGETIHVVTLNDRVPIPVFAAMKKRAEAHDGYYSNYRGRGALPGFTFRDEAKAREFMGVKERTVITPGEDTVIGKNDAGEQLYKRADGSVYRMHQGRPDFGGDLAPSENIEMVVQSLRPGAKPETLSVPRNPPARKPVTPQVPPIAGTAPIGAKPSPEDAAIAKAKQDFDDALGDLGDLIGRPGRKYIVPPDEAKLMPVLTRLMDAAFRMGYYKFKRAARFVRDTIREKLGADVADAVTLDHLQGAYIGMAGKYGQKADSKRDVVSIENLSELEVDTPAAPAQSESEEPRGELPANLPGPAQGAEPAQTGPTAGEREAGPGADADQPGVARPGGAPDAGTGDQGTRAGSARPERELPGKRPSADDRGGERAGDGDTAAGRDGRGATGVNYRISDADELTKGSWRQKARQNIEAIRTLKRIVSEERQATPEEQEKLVKYVGWGATELANNIFENYRPGLGHAYGKGYEEMGAELKALLTPEEYARAKESTQNAHYTSAPIIRAMWRAMERFGFDGGRVLEPGMGVGHFLGLIPESIAGKVKYTGVELDPSTGFIAKQLYPQSDIRVTDFTKFVMPDGFYDAAIGNPPFADVIIKGDKAYRKLNLRLHDYFFVKALDKVRPGGVLMFVTSKGTMDKQGDAARTLMADRADLIGAIRLPQDAFKENAGTEVITDVLFFKKRAPGQAAAGESWKDAVQIQTQDGPAEVNEYFDRHPEMMLGTPRLSGSELEGGGKVKGLYRAEGEFTLLSREGVNIEEAFNQAVDRLPENVYEQREVTAPTKHEHHTIDVAPNEIKEGAYYLKDGKLLQRNQGVGKEPDISGVAAKIVTSFIPVRDAVKEVIQTQLESDDTKALKAAQRKLDKAYDAFVAKHGPLNKEIHTTIKPKKAKVGAKPGKTEDDEDRVSIRYPNIAAFSSDPEAYRVAAIEEYDGETGVAKKRAIFTERVINPPVEPETSTPADALIWSLNEYGRLELAAMAERLGMDVDAMVTSLGDAIYQDPATQQWTTDDDYLSGDVRAKLRLAEESAKADRAFDRNVEALKKVQPRDLKPSEIDVRLGAPWLDTEHIEAFASEALELSSVRVSHVKEAAAWSLDAADRDKRSVNATSTWGTERMNAVDILDDALNARTPRIYDVVRDGQTERRIFNEVATKAVLEKKKAIQQRFSKWIWEDGERGASLAEIYNRDYNNTVPRTFDGKHLSLPGLSSAYKPYDHQKRVAWRIIQRGNTYMAHEVGAGKTIAAVIAGIEMRRLGLVKKPGYVVPKHMLRQFATEMLALYPAAKVLVADEENFDSQSRQRFLGRVQAENWDAVIFAHSSFNFVPVSDSFAQTEVQEMVDLYEEMLADTPKSERTKRKQLERQLKRFREKLDALTDQSGKDRGITYEETGIDFLFVDEAHNFRKLDFPTNMTNVKGVTGEGSKRSMDLFFKTRYMETLHKGRSLVLMSGTPITNTIGEMFTVQRYLQLDLLKARSIHNFDAWAAMFGEEVTKLDPQPDGSYKPVTRFANFVNMPELAQMWGEIGDVVKVDDMPYMKGKRPKVKGGKVQIVVGQQTEAQRAYKRELGERIAAIEARKGPPKKGDDIILAVINDGRHAAMDQRFISPGLPADPDSKIEKAIAKVFDIWERSKEQRLTQMIFADLGTPAIAEKRGFSAYTRIRDALIERGVPASEIMFIQDADTDDKKLRLFKQMNTGEKRVLIGGAGMQEGVNAQVLLKALHNLDAPWLPAAMAQRRGRIERQGNTNKEIEIYGYVTKGSYDEQMFGVLETKQRFIEQFLRGNPGVRVMEDVDSEADAFSEAQALASDDPRVLRLAGLKTDLRRLEMAEEAHYRDQGNLKQAKVKAEREIQYLDEHVAAMEANIARAKDTKGDKFSAKVGGQTFTEREAAGTALIADLAALQKEAAEAKAGIEPRPIGELGGFTIMAGAEDRPTLIQVEGKKIALRGVSWYLDGTKMRFGSDFTLRTDDLSAMGTIRSLENAVQSLGQRLKESQNSRTVAEKTVKDAESRIGAKFEDTAALAEVRQKMTALEGEFAGEAQAKKEAAAAAAEAAPPSEDVRYRKVGATVTAVRDFTDIKLPGLDDVDFYVFHDRAEKVFRVIEHTTGLQIKAGAQRQGAVEDAKETIERIGAQKVRDTIANAAKITDEEKKAAEKRGAMLSRRAAPDRVQVDTLENGLQTRINRDVRIEIPRRMGRQTARGGAVMYVLYDTPKAAAIREAKGNRDDAHIGMLELHVTPDQRVTGLSGLFINKDLQDKFLTEKKLPRMHYGEKVVRAILSTLPEGATLQIHGILPEAVGFWEKMGTRIGAGRILDDGTLTRDDYERSRGRIEDGVGASELVFSRGERGAQAQDLSPGAQGNGRPALGVQPGQSGGQLRRELSTALGKSPDALGIRIIESWNELPHDLAQQIVERGAYDVQGIYDPDTGTTHLIASNIEPGFGLAVYLHEVGVHKGLRGFVGNESFDRLAGQIETWAQASGTEESRLAARAAARITPDVGEAQRAEELVAYFVEEAVAAGHDVGSPGTIGEWLRALAKAIMGAIRKLGGNPAELTARDIVALARGAADHAVAPRGGRAAMLFSRRSPIDEQATMAANVRAAFQKGTLAQDEGVLNPWNKTVGTPELVARKNPAFAKVFWEGQAYLADVNRFVSWAEGMLPAWFKGQDVLSRWFDRVRGKEVAKAEKAAEALLDGTLANVVYTEDQLKARGLTPREIAMYGEARFAVDQIIERNGVAMIAKLSPQFAPIAQHMVNIYQTSGMDGLEEFGQYSERVGQATVRRLEDEFADATTEERRTAVKARLEAAQAQLKDWKLVTGSVSRIVKLQNDGYFPLSRFGRHYVNVTDPRGETVEFRMYESEALARIGAGHLTQKYPKSYNVVRGTISQHTDELYEGLTPESVELFAEITGMDQDPVMQAYLKEAVANRSTLKRMIHRKGTPGYSKDAVRVLADFISTNARASSRLAHASNLTQYAREIEGGELRDYAISLVKYLRGDDGREEYHTLRGFLFFQYIGGNVSSALLNLSQVPMFTVPWLSQHINLFAAGKLVSDAYRMMLSTDPEKVQGELGAALRRAEEEGITDPQNVYTTMAIGAGSKLARVKAFSGLVDAWAFLFGRAETLNRRVTFVAAYNVAKQNPSVLKEGQTAYDFAAEGVRDTQFIYNKGNRPAWARGIGAIPFTFKLFTVQALETIFSRLPKRQAAMLLALMFLAAGAEGLPFAEDLEDILDTVGQHLGYATNSKKWLAQQLQAAFQEWLGLPRDQALMMAEMMRKGVFAGTPLASIGARIGMGNLVPGTSILLEASDKARELSDAIGPLAGFTRGVSTAAEMIARGEYGRAAEAALPRGVANVVKGSRQMEEGRETTPFGKEVAKVSTTEAAMQMLGVASAGVSRAYERQGIVKQDELFLKLVEDRIADKWAQAIIDKDPAKAAEARADLREHNEKNPEAKIRITPQQIQSRVKNLRKDAEQGLIGGVAKERRAGVREFMRETAQ